ncbi:MAG: hypothetical protein OXH69_23570 [Acidobacteria bacterium]|nr:hypothetical protein [Acidobacteriota bacterium]
MDSAESLSVQGLSPRSPAAFYKADAEHLPGRPYVREQHPVLAAEATRYSALLYFLRHHAGDASSVVVNMPELIDALNRSPRWIRRGFHTLAACGLVYSVPTRPEDGVDRRRYRYRLCLRDGTGVPDDERALALAEVALTEDEEADFPADAAWTRTGRRPHSAPADPEPPDGAGAPAASAPATAGPGAAVAAAVRATGSRAAPLSTRQELSGRAAEAAAVIAGDFDRTARDRLVVTDPRLDLQRPLKGTHPDFCARDEDLVDDTVAAVQARLGELRTVPVANVEGEIVERAADYRDREAARCAIVHRLGPEADLDTTDIIEIDIEKEMPDFVPPWAPDFVPGRSGWIYSGGCWHAPRPVCGCFVKGFVRDRLADLTARSAPAGAPSV